MAEFKYLVSIEHRDRGVGFNARQALQNCQRQPTSPIKQVRFSEKSSSSHTTIEVIIEDTPLAEHITHALNNSGRLSPNYYTIKSIEYIPQQSRRSDNTPQPEKHLSSAQRQLLALRDENDSLHQQLSSVRPNITTPLEALLLYFDTTNYQLHSTINDPAEINYVRWILSDNHSPTFVSYLNRLLDEQFSAQQINEALNHSPQSQSEITELEQKRAAIKEELEFLEKIRSGETDIPPTLRPAYIQIIESKDHPHTLETIENTLTHEKIITTRKATIEPLHAGYNTLCEKIGHLTSSERELPLILNYHGDGIEIYLPFRAVNTPPGLIVDLSHELTSYFAGSSTSTLENNYVAYRITTSPEFSDAAEQLVESPPITLRLSGYSRIIPYTLG